MAETLICRGCHRALQDDAGCALCLPVKPHLMPADAVVDDDTVPLAQLAQEAASLLRRQLKQLQVEQRTCKTYNAAVAHESRQHASALSKLLDSARKVVEDGADAVQAMSLQERIALFVEWFGQLPAVYRKRLLEQLQAGEFERAAKSASLPDEVSRGIH